MTDYTQGLRKRAARSTWLYVGLLAGAVFAYLLLLYAIGG